ncbi:Hypothetical predicted protein [Mytilus galloprovincialis]|uniref:Reverse transcriptase domain-containing protein n=1 Tax=Mytilus galloprovincialis TaxID=29158 RepID=A0A8B6BYR1_MYTGA|nr:Hypothetical predicted protein [Mytilus galloprovincialis]
MIPATLPAETIYPAPGNTTLHQPLINTGYALPIETVKASDDIARNVSQNVKQKVINGEYVDMGSLLNNSQNITGVNQTLTFNQGQIILQPKQQDTRINTIVTWDCSEIQIRSARPQAPQKKQHLIFNPLHQGKAKITQDSVLLEHLWDKGKTPVKIKSLRELLSNYENKTDAAMLLLGFIEGFRLNYTGPRISSFASNLISAEVHKTETNLKLQKEVHLGRMLGPFSKIPISTLRISPIGVVSKNDGGWRLITHLSYPLNWSVNDFIDPEICKVKYSSFDKVVGMISELGNNVLCAKMDISQAFRILLVHPADFDLLGIFFDGKYYINKCLPEGCSISCALFEKFATFLHKTVALKAGIETLDHYLDDFFFAGESSTDNCTILMDTFNEVCRQLGVPLAENKTVGPTTCITFLGLEIDTVLMLVRIPPEKLDKLKFMLDQVLSKKKMALKELESITGLMAFCSRAIISARAFIRRFYDLIASVKNGKPYYTVRLNSEVKADMLEFG